MHIHMCIQMRRRPNFKIPKLCMYIYMYILYIGIEYSNILFVASKDVKTIAENPKHLHRNMFVWVSHEDLLYLGSLMSLMIYAQPKSLIICECRTIIYWLVYIHTYIQKYFRVMTSFQSMRTNFEKIRQLSIFLVLSEDHTSLFWLLEKFLNRNTYVNKYVI